MAGRVSTSVKIKGRVIHIARELKGDSKEEFVSALKEIGAESSQLRKVEKDEIRGVRRAYRKKKSPKDA